MQHSHFFPPQSIILLVYHNITATRTVPYFSSPSGDGGYAYAPQQLALGAEGAKTTNRYGENERLCEL